MAITSYSQRTTGRTITVTVESDLSDLIYYHWYVSGSWAGVTVEPSLSITLPAGAQARVECIDTNDEDFDPADNLPSEYPSTRTIWWTRSTSTDVSYYTVEQKDGSGDYVEVARVWQTDDWAFSYVAEHLSDLTAYTWRITPVDENGNSGSATTIGPETIVRRPDAPDFTIDFDEGTAKVTFEAV